MNFFFSTGDAPLKYEILDIISVAASAKKSGGWGASGIGNPIEDQELDALMEQVKERMKSKAMEKNADGVVNVSISVRFLDRAIEMIAFGTTIRLE